MAESTCSVPLARRRDVVLDEVVDVLGRAYDVGDWVAWRRTSTGSANLSFFVTASSGEYVLRCSRAFSRKTVDGLKFEVRLIEYLREQGYPAPQLVPSRRGEGYVEWDGTFYLMTVLIPGSRYDPDSPAHLAAAGRAFGDYHRLVRGLPGPYYTRPSSLLSVLAPPSVGVLLGGVERLAEGLLDAEERAGLNDTFSYLRGQLASVHRELAELYPVLEKLVVQGSFGRTALIFDGDALAGVVDYDRARLEVRGIDLAYAVRGFCCDNRLTTNWTAFDLERCRAFMTAYREREHLPAAEASTLPLLFGSQQLVKVLNKCERLLTKHAVVPQQAKDVRKVAEIAARQVTRLRWLEEHRAELLAALAE